MLKLIRDAIEGLAANQVTVFGCVTDFGPGLLQASHQLRADGIVSWPCFAHGSHLAFTKLFSTVATLRDAIAAASSSAWTAPHEQRWWTTLSSLEGVVRVEGPSCSGTKPAPSRIHRTLKACAKPPLR